MISESEPVDALEYLRSIHGVIHILSSDHAAMEIDDDGGGGQGGTQLDGDVHYHMDAMARTLLEICDVQHLVQPIPTSLVLDPSSSSPSSSSKVHRYRQRIDVLRQLFRVMAPIALDIAARIQTITLRSIQSSDSNSTSHEKTTVALQSYLLYSIWLPVAPQIASIVNDLFLLSDFPCPLVFANCGCDEGDSMTSERLLVSLATNAIVQFYSERGEHNDMKRWWNWSPLYEIFGSTDSNSGSNIGTNNKNNSNTNADTTTQMDCSSDSQSLVEMLETERGWAPRSFDHDRACMWYIARAITHLMNLSPASRAVFLQDLGMQDEMVPWVLHPWIRLEEEEECQENQIRSVGALVVNKNVIKIGLPTPKQMRSMVSLHPALVDMGNGITLPRSNTILAVEEKEHAMQDDNEGRTNESSGLQMSPTTWRNMSLLGTALSSDPFPQPVLVCGPRGSGKSSLIRELSRLCASELLELYIDDDTDSKTLIGSYVVTDVPGEFIWKPGALTDAILSGKWVLLENIETYPMEIQAALVQLFEQRILRLDGTRTERCHSNFRIFGTCTTENGNMGRGGRLLQYEIWRKVHLAPLEHTELKDIGKDLHPALPESILESVLKIFINLDQDSSSFEQIGRKPTVREFIKLLGRISTNVPFEAGVTYATESQRMLCLAETVDTFVGWSPSHLLRREFVINVASTIWGLSSHAALRYIEDGRPEIKSHQDFVSVGRSTISRPVDGLHRPMQANDNFAETTHVLQLMQKVGVCISQNEPVLLVGETGCGKTTVLQRLASLSGYELVVQNLSLQTDSTDLLGGYRPLEIRHIARTIYSRFVDLFTGTFSRTQNIQFLDYISGAFEKGQWKRLSQNLLRAAKMGINKCKGNASSSSFSDKTASWLEFKVMAERFEKQRLACDSGIAFAFTEGVLVDAIRTGKWVLLDEINLASSETLQRLCGLLDDDKRSLTLTEKGESKAITRHPNFRLLAAMNPATDVGKKDLPSSLRSRFTELYVDELVDPLELRSVSARYLSGAIAAVNIEETESAINSVDTYLKCRQLAEDVLVDSAGQKPRYTLRSMCRALSASRTLMIHQKFGVKRALLEGFELAFEGPLDTMSKSSLKKLILNAFGKDMTKKELDHPGRRPEGKADDSQYVLVKPFWIKSGEKEPIDWSESKANSGSAKFVLTPSMTINLRRLVRSVASGPWPILLEGPTSAGKTTLVEYLAARTGNHCVRINNHEHTDVQEYTGSYAADSNGKICFKDGILVQALRKGHWVILDELNLAPSEVLEALNRLLDDNRELYLAEINEIVKPHPNFRLFATQNPAGVYGGRKPLSKAFRNRFVEIHVGDIPEQEMVSILEKRCGCPLSHAKILVKVMSTLRKRRSKSSIFQGKDGLITPRDLLRWAGRRVNSKQDLAIEGYMLLAERLRNDQEKEDVKAVIEEHFKVAIDINDVYYGDTSEARKKLELVTTTLLDSSNEVGISPQEIAPTRSLLRLLTLVERCVEHQEPVLLVGETGCGKTTVVQLMSLLLSRNLQIVNCHATSETSDFLGGLRPLRGRHKIFSNILEMTKTLAYEASQLSYLREVPTTDEEIDKGIRNKGLDSIKQFLKQVSSQMKASESAATHYRQEKRRKLDSSDFEVEYGGKREEKMMQTIRSIEMELKHYNSLFEWVDGPLVDAMKAGHLFLLDEMSLAEDAVLERLNSVLEPTRTLVLAEKGGDSSLSDNSSEATNINAHRDFRIFATMNPGGDFGKRELSPALRSRFTEIWVPAVKDRLDIGIILERSLNSMLQQKALDVQCVTSLREKILDYVDWFNNTLCSIDGSRYTEFTLSLRDVLSWSRFIIDATSKNKHIGLWKAYIHGALLMHLDGLGLGTGLSQEDAQSAKMQAKEMLKAQVPLTEQRHLLLDLTEEGKRFEESCLYEGNRFGIKPFLIPIGSELTSHSTSDRFNFNAPTTGLNLKRVLRALQLSKPILLEGSPGVGKTSLITALAKASGNKLVRINLSEQTDIADLMGSDQPVAESQHDDSGAGDSGLFKWCDGILLSAIKQGQWVLLDELNLASQSVLEGLNSCLDHRANVYIPEIGKTFACPASFRIFAAQNPLAQGGGRKGLPKSFLNRFTKVYVEALSPADLENIVLSQFPTIPEEVVQKMVKFNSSIQEDIEGGKYGQSGSPWEFNLRDIFRWCELVCKDGDATEGVTRAEYVKMIYTQRMRDRHDRNMIMQRHKHEFGSDYLVWKTPTLRLDITRINQFQQMCGGLLEPTLLHSLMTPIETAGFCVEMKWPCLLVGPPSTGKSTVVKVLSESSNIHLEEISLTSATDVSELIGCFEQTDVSEIETRMLQTIDAVASHASLTLIQSNEQQKSLKEMLSVQWNLNEKTRQSKEIASSSFLNENGLLFHIEEILNQFERASVKCCEFSESSSALISTLRDDLMKLKTTYTYQKKKAGLFRWVDGILVRALEKGYWLHLENVNLCPSSVLDRLNPLLEGMGYLELTECGVQDSDKSNGESARRVQIHPNFRLFLSMNPTYGEISRAMRNRCIEVYLAQADVPQIGDLVCKEEVPALLDDIAASKETLDLLEICWNSGLRASSVVKSLFTNHCLEHIQTDMHKTSNTVTSRLLRDWAILVSSSLRRGFIGLESLQNTRQIAYGLDEIANRCFVKVEDGDPCHRVMEGRDLRKMMASHLYSTVANEARLLRSFINDDMNLPLGLSSFETVGSDDWGQCLNNYAPPLATNDKRLHSVKAFLLSRFVSRVKEDDAFIRASYLEGYDSTSSMLLRFLVAHYHGTVERMKSANAIDGPCTSIEKSSQNTRLRLLHLAHTERLASIGDQYLCFAQLEDVESIEKLSAVEVSYCLQESKIDRSEVNCQVTPLIYPLLSALLGLYESWEKVIVSKGLIIDDICISAVEKWLSTVDRMWDFISSKNDGDAFVGIDDAGFIVHWTWLRKATVSFNETCCVDTSSSDEVNASRGKLDQVMKSLDRVLFNTNGDYRVTMDVVWKRSHPFIPRYAQDWNSIHMLQLASNECSYLSSENCGLISCLSGHHRTISLKSLMDDKHMSLCVGVDMKRELLTALCTLYWATTEEIPLQDSTQRGAKALEAQSISKHLLDKVEDTRTNYTKKLDNIQDNWSVEQSEELMHAFASVQTNQIVEFWCIEEEKWIIDSLAQIVLDLKDDYVVMLREVWIPRVKYFISVVLRQHAWSVYDLRPYQTLVWAFESPSFPNQSLRQVFDCLFSRLYTASSNHTWFNSFTDITSVTNVLAVSVYNDSDYEDSAHTVAPTNESSDWNKLATTYGTSTSRSATLNAFFFHLMGLESNTVVKIPFMTLENFDIRQHQMGEILHFLSKGIESSNDESLHIGSTKYLFFNTIKSLLQKSKSDIDENICYVETDEQKAVLRKLIHSHVPDSTGKLMEDVINPLLDMFQSMNTSKGQNLCALTSLYTGLLRFHALLPRSALDPGKKPYAKMVQWQVYIDKISSQIAAQRMESGLTTGCFEPQNEVISSLVEKATRAELKRDSQDKKRVERPSNAPQFLELYQELHQFSKTIASVDNVLHLVKCIESSKSSTAQHRSAWEKELNWQSSVAMFCGRLLSKYACYEDVISPILAAVNFIQNGLRKYASLSLQSRVTTKVASVEAQLLQYPNIDFLRGFQRQSLAEIDDAFRVGDLAEPSGKFAGRFRIAYFISILSNMQILMSSKATSYRDILPDLLWILSSIVTTCDKNAGESNSIEDSSTSTQTHETEEERNERQFRDQFPDHEQEFKQIIVSSEQNDFMDDDQEQPSTTEDKRSETIIQSSITEEHILMVAELHSRLFSTEQMKSNDFSRIGTFQMQYEAVSFLNNILRLDPKANQHQSFSGSHCFAAAINASLHTCGNLPSKIFDIQSCEKQDIDFYHDPNPKEVIKAARPLNALLGRVVQLLVEFPGNTLLEVVGTITRKLIQKDLSTVSIGKMLTGLEVILRKAQEWEQHASRHVALGKNLTDVSNLVASWRKLEMQSWSNLLNMRDKRFSLHARKFWLRLYRVLILRTQNDKTMIHRYQSTDGVTNHLCPDWVWRGTSRLNGNDSTIDSIENHDSILEIVKTLDTFLLTSNLGQFAERLRLVEAFSNQLLLEARSNEDVCVEKVILGSTMQSLCEHYNEFLPTLMKAKERLREPIETRLKGEVKLAKWDEQSYYALADSAEKSHRKLMSFVREYEDVLYLPVSKLLEEDFIHGIRSTTEVCCTSVKPVTDIPSKGSIFPKLQENQNQGNGDKSVFDDDYVKLRQTERSWTNLSQDDVHADKFLKSIQKYSKRMKSIFAHSVPSSARKGADEASFICETIFVRIEALREKGTKTMKQRALFDLFKYTREGLPSSIHWSIPDQVRNMSTILQLPTLIPQVSNLSFGYDDVLKQGEKYFRRCTVELAQLRSEVAMFGTVYLTQNDTRTMISLSEQGLLLLCQQRCNLSSIIENTNALHLLMKGIEEARSDIPSQDNLIEAVKVFDQSFSSLKESLKQLSLVIRTLAPLSGANGNDKGREIISAVEGSISVLTECYNPNPKALIITSERIKEIDATVQLIKQVQKDIKSCVTDNRQSPSLPMDIFEPIHTQLSAVITCAARCKENEPKPTKASISKAFELTSQVLQKSLLAAQTFHHKSDHSKEDSDDDGDNGTIWQNHRQTLEEWQSIGIEILRAIYFDLWEEIKDNNLTLNDDDQDATIQSLFADVSSILLQVMDRCQTNLGDYLEFYRSAAKLEYVKLRLFRTLVAKGFCADNTKESDDNDGDGGVDGMNFEDDADGTGMGEGEGTKDVTDELENEEQLLGLKGDEEADENNAQDQKELDKEEADTGMEMENDFDGDMFDVPEDDRKTDDNGTDDEEEIDREMGDGSDPNEEVIDEKLWDEDESDDEALDAEEKFEKDSKIEGEALQDELRTKEEDDKQEESKPESPEDQKAENSNNDDTAQDEIEDSGENINNDYEDDYEDKPVGVDVRDEENLDDASDEGMDGDDANSLDDDMNLDDKSDEIDPDLQEEQTPNQDELDQDELDQDGLDQDELDEQMDDQEMEPETSNSEHVANAEEDPPEVEEEENLETSKSTSKQERKYEEAGQGISSQDGEENVIDTQQEEETSQQDNMQQQDGTDDNEGTDSHGGGQGFDGGDNDLMGSTSQSSGQNTESKEAEATDVPNPFRDPGDAEKFWHRKLNMVSEKDETEEDVAGSGDNQDQDGNCDENNNADGMFEFASAKETATSQVLGANDEDDEDEIEPSAGEQESDERKEEDSTKEEPTDNTSSDKAEHRTDQKRVEKQQKSSTKQTTDAEGDECSTTEAEEQHEMDEDDNDDEGSDASVDLDEPQQNEIVTDLSQLKVESDDKYASRDASNDLVETTDITSVDMKQTQEAQLKWSQIQAETHSLSQRLCEKLRLVMEPLLKTKLRGDYRSGKRINMKRVIGYIASNYRKDKIWLRRTKPAKRDYRVLLAIDNSESMRKGNAGDKALAALSTMANGMRQLEIGELGIASFGEEMKLLHSFDIPFTSSSGVDLVSNFTFSDKRTETALCVESALAALGNQLDTSSTQLVFMISDGRVERDSRLKLRKLVREMADRNILLVMLIVEGDKKDSIVTMKEVTFENGRPKVKHFIEGYPFPYYIVLNDMNTLPEILGDALRQWFEALAQSQATG